MNAPTIAAIELTNATIVAALVAAFVAVFSGILNLYAAYRLKVKEFRVTQIKFRIDTLEQAAVFSGPEQDSETPEEYERPSRDVVHKNVMKANSHRLTATEKQFTKYKWLLNPECHKSIEEQLSDCTKRFTTYYVDAQNPAYGPQNLDTDLGLLNDKTHQLKKTYEGARLAAIERLYLRLNKEVGI